jgi:hypothetical protein
MAGASTDFGARFSPESCQTSASVVPNGHQRHPEQLRIQIHQEEAKQVLLASYIQRYRVTLQELTTARGQGEQELGEGIGSVGRKVKGKK